MIKHLTKRVPPQLPPPKVAEDTQRKRAEAMYWRRQGYSYQKIADQMGISKLYARKLFMQGMASILVEEAGEMRKMENMRLDDMWRETVRIMQQEHLLVSGGAVVLDTIPDSNGRPVLDEDGKPVLRKMIDDRPKIEAMKLMVKIMERRAKLNGLDMPVKVAQTDPTGEQAISSNVVLYLPSNERDSQIAS